MKAGSLFRTNPSGFPAILKSMVLEVAILNVLEDRVSEFQAAFVRAQDIIASMSGYRGHELQRCIEKPNRFLLLVRWEDLESHTLGFRNSPEYQDWKELLHSFYDPFPEVEHYTLIQDGTYVNSTTG